MIGIASSESDSGARNSSSTDSPISGKIDWQAVTRYVQNRIGSLSSLSRDTHAAGFNRRFMNSLNSVVFPNPAGPDTNPKQPGRSTPESSLSIKSVRAMAFSLAGGINSFVARTEADMVKINYTSRIFYGNKANWNKNN